MCLVGRGTEGLLPSFPSHSSQIIRMVSALLQLKGDVKETYKVLFVAQVVTSP